MHDVRQGVHTLPHCQQLDALPILWASIEIVGALKMIWNDIKTAKIPWAAADTEAHTYVDGARLAIDELLRLAQVKDAAWWRAHTTVHVYAWLISDGHDTACFDTWEEFSQFCADHQINTVWWYNAKYDFSHIDYAMLTSGWTANTGGKMANLQYRSLHGKHGQRYSLTVSREYQNKSRHKHVHTTKHYDLFNIFRGGLDKNLRAFDVRDFDGTPIRKLDMDYQSDDIDAARPYMVNDVKGLYHLVRTADVVLRDRWGYTLTGDKPDIMTAGGLAKRVLLSYYNGGSKNHTDNVKQFQKWHKIDLSADHFYRAHGLYRGGITFVNPAYQNIPLTRPLYKYDINSMYPFQMFRMPDLVDRPYKLTFEQWERYPKKDDFHPVYMIDQARGVVRDGMLPLYYDRKNREFSRIIDIQDNDTPCMFFADEWNELMRWYECDYHIKAVYFFRKAPAHQFRAFVVDNYELKRTAKIAENKVLETFAKLLLNSAYGKLSENPIKDQSHRELNPETGAVMLVDDGDIEDEKCLLSVVVGGLITSMARVQLMQLIRATCPVPARDFVYCDTDSIAAFTQYANPDAYTLGALKDETEVHGVQYPYTWSKYIAPKTYILVRDIDGVRDIECHTKGLPLSSIICGENDTELERVGKISREMSIEQIDTIFAAGRQFVALSAMNVRGGKALVPTRKFLCRTENTIMHGSNHDPENIEILEEA